MFIKKPINYLPKDERRMYFDRQCGILISLESQSLVEVFLFFFSITELSVNQA